MRFLCNTRHGHRSKHSMYICTLNRGFLIFLSVLVATETGQSSFLGGTSERESDRKRKQGFEKNKI